MKKPKSRKIIFVTVGSFEKHATLKRATGMACPLMESGYDVHLILEKSDANIEKVYLDCPNVNVHWFMPFNSPVREAKFKQSVINRENPDVVWICGVGPRNCVKKSSDKCLVYADHSELYSRFESHIGRIILYWLIEWYACLRFEGHICASRYLERFYQNRLEKIGKNAQVLYSPYAYGQREINRIQDSNSASRIPSGKRKILLYLGGFRENYGFWDILKAARKLSENRNDFTVLMVGRGPEEESGRSWIESHNLHENAQIMGYVSETQLPTILVKAHAFLSPLRDTPQDWARCPSKLFMYIPYNRPVITCAIGEAYQLFKDSGLYYEPGNVDSLHLAMNRSLDIEKFSNPVFVEDHSYSARAEGFKMWEKKFIQE